MRLAQLMAAAAPADAVTNQALAWRRVLAEHGIASEIYAEHVHPELAGSVRRLDRFPDGGEGPTLLRYSIWSAAVDRALTVPPERLGFLYHNITPGHLLARHQPELAALCDRGRHALPGLARRVGAAIADSAFNARELEAADFPDVVVVPLLLDLPAEPPQRTDAPTPTVLSVGRVVPSKRLEEAVRAVALLHRQRPDVRLEVIGSWDGFDRYRAALDDFAARLGIADAVRFRGRVSDAERDRAYAEAGVYLCTSAHEGFCAPLVEAMSRGVPVVAHDAGAVRETLGGAGLVVRGADAALTSEALGAVLGESAVRAAISRRADARLRALAPTAVEPQILAAVRPLIA